MKTLGLDIGTTTISAVVLENGAELDYLLQALNTYLASLSKK